MIYKWIGVIFIICSCGSVGFKIAANYKKEERCLQNLSLILEYLISELQYNLTPLPQLCKQASRLFNDFPANIFEKISEELEKWQKRDAAQCIRIILDDINNIPPITREQILRLGNTLGRFDIEGQIQGITSVKHECERHLQILRDNQDSRLRNYQTLGICTGAALAILFI